MDSSDLRFTRTHEWIRLDGEIATIGISDFAVKQLTDLVYVELPEVGRNVNAGDSFGEVESVKAVSDLYAAVAGEIVEVHEALADNPALLSDDPFGDGWIVRIRVTSPEAIENLLNADDYRRHCQSEMD